MNHDTSTPPSHAATARPAIEPPSDATRPRPAMPWLHRLGAALMRRLRRAEKRITDNFRVPPNGA